MPSYVGKCPTNHDLLYVLTSRKQDLKYLLIFILLLLF